MAKRRKRTRVNLGAVTTQDFVAIAKISCVHNVPDGAVRAMAHYFGSKNPRFNTERYIAATKKC